MEKRLRDAQQTRVKSAAGLVQFADAAIASAALDAIREHRPIEVFLGLEVAENNSFVYAGGFRDLARAGAVEALLGKKLHRDVDELFLAIWRGKSHGTKVSAYLLYSHGNNSASLGFTVCHDGIDETYNQGFRCPNGRICQPPLLFTIFPTTGTLQTNKVVSCTIRRTRLPTFSNHLACLIHEVAARSKNEWRDLAEGGSNRVGFALSVLK